MKIMAVFGLAAAVLLATASCGSSGPASYLATGRSGVLFIQWQAPSSGRMQGTMSGVEVSGKPPNETLSSVSYPFTGTINGSSVTFTFSVSSFLLSSQPKLLGTVNGSTLTLQNLQSNGTIQNHVLTQADVASYNHAVTALRSRFHQANVQAAAALARQRQQEAAAAAAAKARAVKAANKQAAINKAADALAQSACKQFGGQWSSPDTVSFTADGYNLSITGGPQDASCDNVSYLGSDDSTYCVSIYFSTTGAAQPAGSGTGTANQSECSRGYYPDDSIGPSYAKPGNWSNALGLCLTSG